MKEQINLLEAYKAMICFLKSYYKNTESDDIGALLGDLQLLKSGGTADPAAWEQWIDCVDRVIKNENV